MFYKVTPLSKKERSHVEFRGDVWKQYTGPHVPSPTALLLVSITDGYLRWWKNEQIQKTAAPTGLL